MKANINSQNKEEEAEAMEEKSGDLDAHASRSPMVSVIICTYNRHEILQRALQSVLLHQMQDMEVIIVDDGSDTPVEIPSQSIDKVRLIRTKHVGVGHARAEGLNAAKGTYIAYCDDDDEWKPNHLNALLNYLQEHPEVDLVYADSEWVVEGQPPKVAYSIDYDITDLISQNYIFATDVLHKASAAREAGGFNTSLQAYEDWDLWLRMSKSYVFRHLPVALAVHYWHSGCVSAANQWQEWDVVYQNHKLRLGQGGVAQSDLIPDAAPLAHFDKNSWKPGRRELIWHSHMSPGYSFTYTARPLLLALEKIGVDITMAPTRNQPPKGFERFYKPLNNWGKFAFYYDFSARPSVLKSERNIVYLMWESTSVPPEQVENINEAATLLYVPCKHNVDIYRDCGIKIPIKVLHHGIDPKKFPVLDRNNDNRPFTFGSFGEFSPRKGIDVLIRAFQDEFLANEPVRLLLKTNRKPPPYEIRDSRVELVKNYLDHNDLLEFLRKMDVFVLPSRGEGFGLAALEAMSTGVPLIATNWSGPVEYLDARDSFPLDYKMVDTKGTLANGVQYKGQWAEPDYEHLRYLLRYLYEHPEEAAEKGRMAAARAHKEWTRERLAIQMCQDLDEIAAQ